MNKSSPALVRALRSGNRFVLDPTTPEVLNAVRGVLEYEARVSLEGKARAIAVRNDKSLYTRERRMLYAFDHRKRLATTLGNWEITRDALKAAGFDVQLSTVGAPKDPETYKPYWGLLKDAGFKFRHRQLEVLQLIARYPTMRIDWPTGAGKGYILAAACCLFPKAKIGVATRSAEVVLQRLYPELCAFLPSVGVICGGKKVRNKRVMVYTTASLHHAEPGLDFIHYDECHEAGADTHAEALARFDHAHMIGYSGSHDLRTDGLDARVMAIFGPVRSYMSYSEAEANGMVVPIEVRWSDYPMDSNPCDGLKKGESVERNQVGIWSNEARNCAIAEDMRKHEHDQAMIAVSTIEHGLYLKRLLPDFELVYRQGDLDPKRMKRYQDAGLLEGFQPMTEERRYNLTAAFEDGRLRKAIATQVWRVGVNFKQLSVLARADAGGSAINDRQIPGRTSRIFQGKGKGIIYDYVDRFDSGFAYKATTRHASYGAMEWTQSYPASGPPAASAGYAGEWEYDA